MMTATLVRFAAISLFVLGMVASPARADDLSDARAVIAKQVELIKAGDATKLKLGFTTRLRAKITPEVVKKAAKQVGTITVDELVGSVTPGKDTLRIKMKNERTLTTLVKVNGAWLADTLWFK